MTPDFHTLKITFASTAVAVVALNRPEVHHALSPELISELTTAMEMLNQQGDIRVIVLTASGPSFCAGADLHWMKNSINLGQAENLSDAKALDKMFRTIAHSPKATIACVNGNAFGGGVGLIAACDVAIALSSALFCFSEVKLGILPAVISPYILNKIPHALAKALMLSAKRFNATQATGLITQVVETKTELEQHALDWINHFLAASPDAILQCKALFYQLSTTTDELKTKNITTHAIASQRISPQGQAGLNAFAQKQTPPWVTTLETFSLD